MVSFIINGVSSEEEWCPVAVPWKWGKREYLGTFSFQNRADWAWVLELYGPAEQVFDD